MRPALQGFRRSLSRLRHAGIEAPKPSPSAARSVALAAASNAQFRNKHRGQRCFICATGPSLTSQDLSPLARELCIGVSFFFLHPHISTIRPRYHVLAPNHAPFDFDLQRRYFDGIRSNYPSSTVVFCGYRPYEYSSVDFLAQEPTDPPNRIQILDYSRLRELDETNYANEDLWDIAGNPFEVRTVVYGAIQVAAYMGCSPIYLLGCDHDYLLDLGRTENHFYLESSGNPQDRRLLEQFTTERWFEEYHLRWRDYRLMRTYLNGRGMQIFNATEGGLLDVFPRVSLGAAITTTSRGS